MEVVVVILAGGSGKRLWPLSRKQRPKQYLPFGDSKTLISLTIERVSDIVEKKNLFVVTTSDYSREIDPAIQLIIEPEGRNTAAAILYSVLEIKKIYKNPTIIFVPADHHIENKNLFTDALNKAANYAQNHDEFVLIGIDPKFPATQYGYISYDKTDKEICAVNKFYEKPDKQIAQKFLESGNFVWNSGIFCAKASVYLDSFLLYADKFYQKMEACELGLLSYSEIPFESFDKLILEHSNNIKVVLAQFDWSDVGNLEQFISSKNNKNNFISINANNNLVEHDQQLAVLVNVDNLCVVQKDGVLLITKREETENIKNVVEYLKNQGYEKYL